MNQPTKDQWEEIAKEMNRLFGTVYLRCDGYLIATQMERDKNRLYITVYVDGWLRGEWVQIVDDPEQFSEVPRKFYRHRSHQRMSARDLKLWEKIIGKRECRKRGYYGRRYQSLPYWEKPMPLIRHLKKHNTDIKVLTPEEYTTEVKPKREAME